MLEYEPVFAPLHHMVTADGARLRNYRAFLADYRLAKDIEAADPPAAQARAMFQYAKHRGRLPSLSEVVHHDYLRDQVFRVEAVRILSFLPSGVEALFLPVLYDTLTRYSKAFVMSEITRYQDQPTVSWRRFIFDGQILTGKDKTHLTRVISRHFHDDKQFQLAQQYLRVHYLQAGYTAFDLDFHRVCQKIPSMRKHCLSWSTWHACFQPTLWLAFKEALFRGPAACRRRKSIIKKLLGHYGLSEETYRVEVRNYVNGMSDFVPEDVAGIVYLKHEYGEGVDLAWLNGWLHTQYMNLRIAGHSTADTVAITRVQLL